MLGFELFQYLSRCLDQYYYKHCIDGFTNESSQTIFEAATSAQELKLIDASRKTGSKILKKFFSQNLFDTGLILSI